ncbi:MAG: type II toxin-antitoxin system Phd/YefM family antitoxin [Gammaproteobacteria bacterium]|nr:type II toxin-antitoxin system Phd/YefM family antitoxin [Gammaproteobacteria bacterium]
MKEIGYSKARNHLKALLDDVVKSNKPVKIIRRDHEDTVIIIGERQYREIVSEKNK